VLQDSCFVGIVTGWKRMPVLWFWGRRGGKCN